MEAQFWQQKWANNEIGFHEARPNPLLVQHWSTLGLKQGRVFVPLCGKTLDIAWLLKQGHQVVGAELSVLAIQQLFAELGWQPTVTAHGASTHYQAHNLEVWVGDIFALSKTQLRSVDAIYDRAALVALPDAMRLAYTQHLVELTQRAPQLVICYEYEQRLMAGPPFSISDQALQSYYATDYQLTLLARDVVVGGMRGQCPARENTWRLQPR